MTKDVRGAVIGAIAGIVVALVTSIMSFRSEAINNLPALYTASEGLTDRLNRLERRLERLEDRLLQ